VQAVSGASAGDEVIVTSGDYSLAATLSPPAQITIHGVAGRPRSLFNAGSGVGVTVRLFPAGRRPLKRVPRLRARNTSVARDGAGASKTTVAAVTSLQA
jgi:hypothetical protein